MKNSGTGVFKHRKPVWNIREHIPTEIEQVENDHVPLYGLILGMGLVLVSIILLTWII